MSDFKDRVFVLKALGKVYGVTKPCCLVCRHRADIFWDYTNGPYLAFCCINVNPEDKNEEQNCCDKFEVDEACMPVEDFQKLSDEEKDAYIMKKMDAER